MPGDLKRVFEIIIKNGKFDAVFDRYFGETIKKANLKNRKLYKIENKNISKHIPLNKEHLWINPLQ